MLLSFTVENHKAFRDAATLSFESTARRDAPSLRLSSEHAKHGVLPIVGVWGANASGKSTVLESLEVFVGHLRNSWNRTPDAPLLWNPFALDRSASVPPTTLVAVFEHEGVQYQYGFSFRASGYEEEWLYRWVGARRQILFERDATPDADRAWNFGAALTGAKKPIAEATRANCLFLSAAAQFNHEQLLPVWSAATALVRRAPFVLERGVPMFPEGAPLLDARHRESLVRLLAAADLGVHDAVVRQLDFPKEEVTSALAAVFGEKPTPMVREMTRMFSEGVPRLFQIDLVHGAADAAWTLPAEMESTGTKTLLRRFNDWLGALSEGAVLVVDELDASLHPDLCVALLELFADEHVNTQGAQLLFATHSRDLLSHLRTDEIVLLDKAPDGAARLGAASDFVDTKTSVRTAHAAGRLGGAPRMGDLVGPLMGHFND